MDMRKRSLIEIHIAVLLFGLTGLFGKFISVSAPYIVLGRVVFATIFLGTVFAVRKTDISLGSVKSYFTVSLLGVLLAVHWTSFYMSVQVSTVAIALLTFSAYPVVVTFIEPIMFHEKLKRADVVFSLVMFFGVLLIVPEFNLDNNLTVGTLWGLAGCVTFAFMSLLNRKLAGKHPGSVIAFYEQGTASVVLLPLLFILPLPVVTSMDWALLILLGVLFTGVAHSMFIGGMRNVRAQTAGIIASLESVYGILAAAVFLGEIPTAREIIGGVIILGTAFCSSWRSARESK